MSEQAPAPRRRRRFDERPQLDPLPGRRAKRRRVLRFRVGDVLASTFVVWFRNFLPFTALTAVVFSPYIALQYHANVVDQAMLYDPIFVPLAFLFSQLLTYVVTATLIYGVFQQLRGRRSGMGESFGRGIARIPSVIGVMIAMFIVFMLAMLPWGLLMLGSAAVSRDVEASPLFLIAICGLFITLAYLVTALYVAIPAAVVERAGPLQALRRSWRLTRGCRMRVLSVYVLLMIVNGIGGAVIGGVSGAAFATTGTETVGWVSALVITVISVTLQAVASAVVYHDLRLAVEGSSTEELASIFD